jgi:hypothetical protein
MRQGRASDLVFLTVVVLLSVVPYITRLGFYSDDWAFLGVLLNAPDQSLSGLVTAQYAVPSLPKRPTQIAYQAVLFKAFGLAPFGYHLVNAAVLASVAILLYFVLREFRVHRTIALSLPAVYVLLPNYSTDRFWFAAFGYALSTALFLASSYAFLRAARSQRLWLWSWTVFALLALTAATLGMEVVIPLALAIPVALWLQAYRLSPGGLGAQLGTPGTILLLCSPLAVVAAVVLYKVTIAEVSSVPGLFYVIRLGVGSLAVNFGTYGVALPHTVAWSFRHLPFDDTALSALLAGLVFSYLSMSEAPPQSRRTWTAIMLVGGAIFGLGTAIFLATPHIEFWSIGIANRVWIAAAVGMSMLLVGGSGWLSSLLSNGAGRRNLFAALVAALCLSGFVINTALSTFWISAWPRQLQVLGDIRRALPVIAPRTTLILHEVCPYVGPAIVFESSWDLAGALQVIYRDQTLRADVTTGRFSIGDNGLSTRIYDKSRSYRYGHDLLLFNEQRQTAVWLTDSGMARSQLAAPPTCPESIPGRGTIALPLDAWFRTAEVKGFRPWR